MYTTSSLSLWPPRFPRALLEVGRSEMVIQLLSRYLSCTLWPHYLQGLQVYFLLCSKLLLMVSALFTLYLYQKGLNFYGELLVDATTSLHNFKLRWSLTESNHSLSHAHLMWVFLLNYSFSCCSLLRKCCSNAVYLWDCLFLLLRVIMWQCDF